MTATTRPDIASLRDMILSEVYWGLGLTRQRPIVRNLELVTRFPAQAFARMAVGFDAELEAYGLAQASRRFLDRRYGSYEIACADRVPASGPLIVAANHPGTFDELFIAAGLPRDDVRFIARDMPFLRALPALSRHLIYANDDLLTRTAALRETIRHLRQGRTLITFPSARLDPDPAVYPGAEESLQSWHASLDLLIRKVPDVEVIIAMVSGIVSRRVLKFPKIRRLKGETQQLAAEVIQVAAQVLLGRRENMRPNVSFSQPFRPQGGDQSPADVQQFILAQASSHLAEHRALFALEPLP